jgi:hypothetical protein
MRVIAAVLVGVLISATNGASGFEKPQLPQTAPATTQKPAAPAQATGPQGRIFASDVGMMFNPIKPEATADFEMVVGRLKEALVRSQDSARQEQAKGWSVYKAQEPGPAGAVLYVFVMNPAVKGADYSVTKILAEAFPAEVQALYQKFSGAYAGPQSLINLSLVQALGQAAGQTGRP